MQMDYEWIKLHILALGIGVILDLLIGDPEWLCHPIRWMGSVIAGYEERWNLPELTPEEKRLRGRRMVGNVLLLTAIYSAVLLILAYKLHPIAGVILEAILSAYMLAAHSLAKESGRVRKALEKDLESGRTAVARIVGRDTDQLTEKGVVRATVETVAENTSDGVIAPLIYLLIGGPVLGCLYKAINTMDSMVGYKTEKYIDFGRAAAKLDDAVNYIPARITAGLLILSAAILPETSGKRAAKIMHRDAKKSTSPNSGCPEAAVAGALGVTLLGDAYYHGELFSKPEIGDPVREITRDDIAKTNQMMFLSEGILTLLTGITAFLLW